MRTKIALILLMTALATVSATMSFGQQKITDMVTQLEKATKTMSKPNSIEVSVRIEKDVNGNLKRMEKIFAINDWPSLVKELQKSFDQEKENALTLTERLNPDEVYKRYIFWKDGRKISCTLTGKEARMLFFYQEESQPRSRSTDDIPPTWQLTE